MFRRDPGSRPASELHSLTVPLAEGVKAWATIASGWPVECSARWLAADYGRVTERQYITFAARSGELLAGAVWYILDGTEQRRGYSAYDLLLGSELEAVLSQLGSAGITYRAEADRLRALLTASALAPCLSVTIPGSYEPAVIWSQKLAPPELDVALRTLVRGVDEAARAVAARSVAFLGIAAGIEGDALRRILHEAGYRGAHQPATAVLDIPADGIPGYLSQLNRKQRKNSEREMRRFAEQIDQVSVHGSDRLLHEDIVCLLQARYEKYGHQTSKSAVVARLEHAQALPGMSVLTAERQGRVCAFKAFAVDDHRRRMVSRFSGCEPNDFYAYFNIVYYEPIRYGSSLGMQSMTMGTESYQAKVNRGSRIERRMAYSRPLDPNLIQLADSACELKNQAETDRLKAESGPEH